MVKMSFVHDIHGMIPSEDYSCRAWQNEIMDRDRAADDADDKGCDNVE